MFITFIIIIIIATVAFEGRGWSASRRSSNSFFIIYYILLWLPLYFSAFFWCFELVNTVSQDGVSALEAVRVS